MQKDRLESNNIVGELPAVFYLFIYFNALMMDKEQNVQKETYLKLHQDEI